jgi:hypothetical protein
MLFINLNMVPLNILPLLLAPFLVDPFQDRVRYLKVVLVLHNAQHLEV